MRASHVKNDYYTNDVQFKRKVYKNIVEISRFMQIESCLTLFRFILDVCFKTNILKSLPSDLKGKYHANLLSFHNPKMFDC